MGLLNVGLQAPGQSPGMGATVVSRVSGLLPLLGGVRLSAINSPVQVYSKLSSGIFLKMDCTVLPVLKAATLP